MFCSLPRARARFVEIHPFFSQLNYVLITLKRGLENRVGIYVELNNFEAPKRLVLLKARCRYRPPDYMAMVRELVEQHEFTVERIAYLLPISGSSSVSEWTKRGRPNFEAGEAFMDLWKTITEKNNHDIPRVPHRSL